jgi:hypothetical protein
MEYRNAKFINKEHTIVDCEINSPVYGWIPYTMHPDDTDMTVDNNVLIAAFRRNNDVANYTPPSYEKLAYDARVERNRRLVYEVDPIVTNPLRWADLTPDAQSAWKQYRTDLLNITNQTNFPYGINWPTKPE